MSDVVGIIPAAGKGRRIREYPLSNILPKPLLPINDICIIESPIRILERAGVDDIIVVVNHKADLIKEYLGDGRNWGVKIRYVYQPKLNGIAGAVMDCEPEVPGDFVVALGDELTILDEGCTIYPMLDEIKHDNVHICVAETYEIDLNIIKDTNEMVTDSGGTIIDMVEKPTDPRVLTRGTGIYACKHSVFDFMKGVPPSKVRGEIEMTDVVNMYAHVGWARSFWLPGHTVNINSFKDLKNAQRTMLGRNLHA